MEFPIMFKCPYCDKEFSERMNSRKLVSSEIKVCDCKESFIVVKRLVPKVETKKVGE